VKNLPLCSNNSITAKFKYTMNNTSIKHNAFKFQKHSLKIKSITFMMLICGFFIFKPAQSQVSVNVNIGSQVLWGPVGYDYVEYYYLPEIDVFYYVPTGEYIYWRGNQQVFVTYLPAIYHVDLYSTYKVVVNEPKPYLQHNSYVVKYAKYKHGAPKQTVIRDSNDQKYFAVKGHPKHDQAKGGRSEGGKSSGSQNNNDGGNRKQNNNSPAKSNDHSQPQHQEKHEQQNAPRQQQQNAPRQQQQQQAPKQQQQSAPKQGGDHKGKGH
jgi:hypothetical protein